MKRILLVFAILFCCSFIFAQDDMGSNTDSGTIYLHGGSNLNIGFSDGTPITVNAKGGYFLADKILAGVGVNFFSFDGNSDTDFAVFGRYYITDALFLGAAADLGDDTIFSGQAGYNIFLSDNVSLEPTFTYPFKDFLDPSISMGISVFL